MLCSNIGLILTSKNSCQVGKLEQNKHENFIPAYLQQEDVTNGTLAIAVHKTNIQITCLL